MKPCVAAWTSPRSRCTVGATATLSPQLCHVLPHLLGATDFDRAFGFYSALAEVLGIQPRFVERDRPWAGWQSIPGPRPLLLIGTPFDGQARVPGNGQMVAFVAGSREQVDRAHALALAHGGTSEGAPGLRPEYHAHYYGAYFRDTEGNKLCVACHVAPGA